MARPRSIKEVEYEILKYIMFNEYGTFETIMVSCNFYQAEKKDKEEILDLLKKFKNDLVDLNYPDIDNDKVKDKALQKRIISAKKVVRNVLGNMMDSRIKYLTEEHIDYGIENYKEIGE